LELQLASAVQRFNNLQRRAEEGRESGSLLNKTLAELGMALEQVRVMHEQLLETRGRVEQLQVELRAQCARYWQLFDAMPDAYVVSKADSTIVEVNQAGAHLFNVSQRFLIGKPMSVFVCEDRAGFVAAAARLASDGGTLELRVKLRPRERAPVSATARVTGDNGELRWVLRAQSHGGTAAAETL
jgi:PAS domain S-box-containing protein